MEWMLSLLICAIYMYMYVCIGMLPGFPIYKYIYCVQFELSSYSVMKDSQWSLIQY